MHGVQQRKTSILSYEIDEHAWVNFAVVNNVIDMIVICVLRLCIAIHLRNRSEDEVPF